MLLALSLLLPAPLLAADDLNALVSDAARHVHDWHLTPADSIGGFIEHAVVKQKTFDALASSVATQFHLDGESARLIVIAELRDIIDQDDIGGDPEDRTRARRNVEALYRSALKKAPSSAAVVREYVVMVNGSRGSLPDADERITAALAGIANRGEVVLEVMNDVRAGYPDTSVLVDTVFREFGVEPFAITIISDSLPSEMSAPLYERAARSWIAQKDYRSAAVAAEGAIEAYATVGLAPDVLRVFGMLPAQSRSILLTPAGERAVKSHGIERKVPGHDVRLSIAAAKILAGDLAAARSMLAEAAKIAPDTNGEQELKAFRATARLLAAAGDPPSSDVFEVITDYLVDGRWNASTYVVDQVFDRVAVRGGYPEIAKWMLDRDAAALQWSREEQIDLPESVKALVGSSRKAARTESRAARDPDTPFFHRLGAQRLTPFVELPANGDGKSAASRCDELAELQRIGVSFPPQFHPLRAEHDGNEIVAIGESHDLDPVGEISGGGYWVVRSLDRGNTWESLYTGLRELQPYELVIDSTIPLIRPDGVRIEVNRKELDESSITFPPIALRTTNEKRGLMLDFRWVDLERDSDGDGLTDLVEERIFTDPHSADSDGDGIDDGADPLPQVAFRRTTDPQADILAAVLGSYYGEKLTVSTLTEPADANTESCEAPRWSRSDQRTMFIVGDPDDFAGLQTSLRAIVVTAAEMEAAEKKFGRTLAVHISPIVIDHTGTRAWVDINDEWRGATYRLEKQEDGSWGVEIVGSWIT
jgi:hypothetical protein